MKRILIIPAVVVMAGFGGLMLVGEVSVVAPAEPSASVQEQTLTFDVENMTCATCPITVRTAMRRVEGVRSVSVDFDAKTATVTFDPSITTPEDIGNASRNAGYPAEPVEL